MARRICVVTGSRAEYGLLYWVLHDLRADPEFDLQLVVTGMHLSPQFGHTVDQIEADGFVVARRCETLLSSDTAGGVAKSIALGVIGMSEILQELQPEVVLILGDRFEIFAVAQACLVHKVPLAHIAGGDVTEGAFDESLRHAITKLAQIHFVTNEDAGARVRQMGEDPRRVHVVGNPGLDHVRRTPLLGRPALEKSLGANLGERNLLITFHPVTLAPASGTDEFHELLAALETLAPNMTFWFTRPNADPGGRAIMAALDEWAQARPESAHVFTSLGQLRYLSLMAQVDAVIGNSSSGLYEAPTLKVPTVDIGSRQKGRLSCESVVHCAPERNAIATAMLRAMALDCGAVVNPYGDGRSSARIVSILRNLPPRNELIRKPFHTVGGRHD